MTDEERIKTNRILRHHCLKLIEINVPLPGQVRCSKCGRYEYPELMHIEKRMRGASMIKVKTCWECKNEK
jgi:hypothetical protein